MNKPTPQHPAITPAKPTTATPKPSVIHPLPVRDTLEHYNDVSIDQTGQIVVPIGSRHKLVIDNELHDLVGFRPLRITPDKALHKWTIEQWNGYDGKWVQIINITAS